MKAHNISRRSFLAVTGSLVLGGLAGCGNSQGGGAANSTPAAETVDTKEEPVPVEIKDSGYYVTEYGYIMYGIVWKNPNDLYSIEYPTLSITGKDANGKILFNDTQVMESLMPGEEQRFGCQAGTETAPASVEFSVTDSRSNYVRTNDKATEYFSIANANEVPGDYETSFTGELTTLADLGDSSQAWVSVILRDGNGKIVYGSNSFADVPAKGQTLPFEVSAMSSLPEHASYELFAIPWF